MLALAVVEEAKVSFDVIVGANVYVVGWLFPAAILIQVHLLFGEVTIPVRLLFGEVAIRCGCCLGEVASAVRLLFW